MSKIQPPKACLYLASGITSTSHDNNKDADYNCLSDCSPVKGHSGSNGDREGASGDRGHPGDRGRANTNKEFSRILGRGP